MTALLIAALTACTPPASDDTDGVDDTGPPVDTGPVESPYTGGWPFNPNKGALGDPGVNSAVAAGAQVGNFTAVDQFGDRVELYDFAGHGKPVVLDVSAEWCLPCRDIAAWMEGATAEELQSPDFFEGIDAFAPVREAVNEGEVFWVTVIVQDFQARPPDEDVVARWAADFPNPHVPVLADSDQEMMFHLGTTSFPSLYVVDEAMVLQTAPGTDGYSAALQALMP